MVITEWHLKPWASKEYERQSQIKPVVGVNTLATGWKLDFLAGIFGTAAGKGVQVGEVSIKEAVGGWKLEVDCSVIAMAALFLPLFFLT